MAMGKRKRQAKQASMWVATSDLPRSAAHPFHTRLNHVLAHHDFDGYVEGLCQRFYAEDGRPGLPPGRYFRLLLIGYFEGLDAERAIAWRAADSFALREFLGLVLPEAPPDHSTISRTRRLIDVETHEAVFTWMLQRLAEAGLVKGKTVGIRSYISEPDRGRRNWQKNPEARDAVYRNRRRIRGSRGLRLLRLRGERLERPFAHLYETGGMRRVYLRGHANIHKRVLIHASGFNLGLLMRRLIGVGTPRGLQGRVVAALGTLIALIRALWRPLAHPDVPLRRLSHLRRISSVQSKLSHTATRKLVFTTGC
jgi:hypothetical protein